jgi:hypothetical protein
VPAAAESEQDNAGEALTAERELKSHLDALRQSGAAPKWLEQESHVRAQRTFVRTFV